MAEPEVKYVVAEILMAAAQSCQGEITTEAVTWWVDHYTETVTRARKNHDDLRWEKDRKVVLPEAQRLGLWARAFAKDQPVSAANAKDASGQVDHCIPKGRRSAIPWKYCD
jgi:hypothetical protein